MEQAALARKARAAPAPEPVPEPGGCSLDGTCSILPRPVERRPVALVDELRHGRGMVRIAVTRWTIRPEPELASESIARALSSGSRFRTVLRASDPKTALTFWVYPDSFSGLRRLQTAAHKAGFRVASRQLPTGITISGSPDGTRAQSQ